jgi:hypothetical protein
MMPTMGLDVYGGPLTRYTLGEWLTIVQQAGLDAGQQVHLIRSNPSPEDVVTDPAEVQDAVAAWQSQLLHALSYDVGWVDTADLPYWTDKPDWDGYGGLMLLAAYDEQPQLRPESRRRLLSRAAPPDAPRSWAESRAFKEAAKAPIRYPTLLSGVEWWLPVSNGPRVFEAARLTGQPTRMGRVDQLVTELQTLATRLEVENEDDLRKLREQGPPPPGATDAESAGRFGLAVFLGLARTASINRQPLLLDY